MKTKPAALTVNEVRDAIDAEPELPGTMPDSIWDTIRGDREAATEVLRANVRAMKKNLKERLSIP